MGRTKDRLVFGWGINDVDYSVTNNKFINGKNIQEWVCPYYEKWTGILQRCFHQDYQKRFPTYKNCTVCEEWKFLSNFSNWVDLQPNKDGINCVPDKDFLSEGKHYSKDTVVFITDALNSFITDRGNGRGCCIIGVSLNKTSKKNPYKAQCHNPFVRKQEYLGIFPTEMDAHLAWKNKKHEHALVLADMQNDARIAKRLREMYSPDKDLTNR